MRVVFWRRQKGGHDFTVDRRGRVRAAEKGGVGAKAAALMAAGALMAVAPGTGPGKALIASGRVALQSAADFIRARSPGLRQRADLINTKHPRRVARAAPRVRRPAGTPALALVAAPPPPVPLVFDNTPFAPAFPPLFAGPVPAIEEAQAVPCCFARFNPPLTTAGGFVIGGGGGGGGGTGTHPTGVPEPSTWALMILGFGVIGTAWRRRRALLKLVKDLPRLFHERLLLLTYARIG
jgi:hypothetical protein